MTILTLRDVGYVGATRGENDPFFSSVSLLLHGNGTNGSTTIVDSSPSPKTVTAFGNAQISTAQSKFGGASVAFDGSGDYLTAGSISNWTFLHNNSTSWTIEGWIYPNSVTLDKTFFETASASAKVGLIVYTSGQNFVCYITRGASGSIFQAITTTTPIQATAWQHIAVVFVSGSTATLSLYVNGTQVATASTSTFSFSQSNPSNNARIGASADFSGLDYNGFFDEVRITRAARYSANFTPPFAPFPDF